MLLSRRLFSLSRPPRPRPASSPESSISANCDQNFTASLQATASDLRSTADTLDAIAYEIETQSALNPSRPTPSQVPPTLEEDVEEVVGMEKWMGQAATGKF